MGSEKEVDRQRGDKERNVRVCLSASIFCKYLCHVVSSCGGLLLLL